MSNASRQQKADRLHGRTPPTDRNGERRARPGGPLSQDVSSYAHLCKRAGLPAPTGLANFVVPKPNCRIRKGKLTADQEKAFLRVELGKIVADGSIRQTADGRYYIP